MTAPDLSRFERMAQRHKQRAAIARDNAMTDAEAWEAQRARDEMAGRNLPAYQEGPPEGCLDCYLWVEHPMGPWWSWVHRQVEAEDDVCRHGCHGVGGRYVPTVIYG